MTFLAEMTAQERARAAAADRKRRSAQAAAPPPFDMSGAGLGLDLGMADDKVWLGGWKSKTQPRKTVGSSAIADERIRRAGNSRDNEVTTDRALAEPWNWDNTRLQQEFARASRAVGQPVQTREQFQAVWEKAVDWAKQSRVAGKPITPYDAMDLMARDQAAVTLDGKTTTTSVAKSVDEVTDGQAWAVLERAAKDMLGRAPTNAELQRFIGKARDIAARNPHVSRTTTTTTKNADGTNGSTTSSSVSKGGMTEGDLALAAQNMAATPEAAAYQAAGTYFNEFLRALDSPVDMPNPVG